MNEENQELFIQRLLKSLDIPEKEIQENLAFYTIASEWFAEYFKNESIDWVIEIGGGRGIVAFLGKYLGKIPRATVIDQYMSDAAIHFQKGISSLLSHQVPEFAIAKFAEYEFEPNGKTVLLGVHCCGSLTDEVIERAVRLQIPFAVMSCCHEYGDEILQQIQEMPENYSDNLRDKMIDLMRIDRARQAGYKVKIEHIDPEITPKNRILSGYPPGKPPRKMKEKLTPINATFGWNQLNTARNRAHHLEQLLSGLGLGRLREFSEIGGNRNQNVKMINRDGRKFIVRIAKTNNDFRLRTLNKLEREARFYELVREQGVPVPEVLHLDASAKYLKDVFMVTECLPGVPLQSVLTYLPFQSQEQILTDAGKMLAKVHSIQLEHPGFLETSTSVIKGAFYASDGEQLELAVEGGLRGLLRKKIIDSQTAEILKNFINAQLPALEEAIQSCRLFHGDFDLTNVLVVPDGTNWRISGLIDGEFSAAGDPGWDWMSLEFKSLSKLQSPDGHNAFFKGYGKAPQIEAYAARMLIYRLLRLAEFKDFFKNLNLQNKDEPDVFLLS